MPITTVPVTCQANRPDGTLIAGGKFRFLLSSADTENGLIVPREILATANSSGVVVASLWPNSLGAAGTQYRVMLSEPNGGTIDLGSCTVPTSACNLYAILGIGPAPTVDQATVAKLAAQQSAAEASASAAASQASRVVADADVVLTHADVVLTHADVVQTGLDRVQTGLDRTASSASATAAAASQSSAATQASNSATSAAASESSATASAGSAATSTSQAAISTAQAVISTTQASNSSSSAAASASSATSASTSATTATTQASLSTTQASASSASAAASASSAAAANTSAGASSGSAAQALAIYGSTASQQAAVTAAQSAQSAAQGYATAAASVVTQDLSGVTAAALHRSPNAVTAMFVYDTSKDSDGGAWTEKCQNTSWYNEALSGNWLGSASNELAARCTNATLGTDVTNGGFDTDTVWTKGAGWVISNGVASMPSGGSPSITQNASQTLALGDIVKVTFTLVSRTGGYAYIVVGGNSSNSGSEQFSTPGTYTRFVPISTLTDQTVGILVGNSPTGISIDNVSFRKITSINTASNDYFQLTTDGKFYRLWKNLFTYSVPQNTAVWTGSTSDYGATTAVTFSSAGAVFDGVASKLARTIGGLTGYSTSLSFTVKSVSNQTVTISYRNPSNGNSVITYNPTTKTASISGVQFSTPIIQTISADTARVVLPFSITSGSNCQIAITGGGTSDTFTDFQWESGTVFTTYEAKTVDGSTTEVFRGNKAKFPKLVGIVAEATTVTLYDLTEAGRPMWMRFVSGTFGTTMLAWNAGNQPIYTTSGLNGKLSVGMLSNGMLIFDFAKDDTTICFVNSQSFVNRKISARNSATTFASPIQSLIIVNATVYSIAMTVLPDAPLDPVTGLQVPTIWVCTAGGLSVIQQNGIVVSNTDGAVTGISVISPAMVQIVAVSGSAYHGYARLLQGVLTIFGRTSSWIAAALPKVSNQNNSTARLSSGQKQQVAIGFGLDPSNVTVVTRLNASNPLQNISTYISSLSNTGYMLGDIRRAYLADSVVENVGPTAELVVNGTFDTDVSGWTISSGTATSVSGVLQLTNAASNVAGVIRQTIPVVVGKTYRVTGQGGLGNNGKAAVLMGTTIDASNLLAATWSLGLIVNTFVATTSNIYVKVICQDATSSYYGSADNISIKELVADRSYKAANANIYGTLTKALTNTANQVVAYSGFSSANYLQEPYSADLDFGTGEWSVSAWVNIPTANAAAGVIADRSGASGASIKLAITAANLLQATVYDGTTTRTVTTTTAYNTATLLKARAVYKTDGSLAITVNGVQVAITYGNPLLTLNNSSAVLTIGNSYALDAPFPGSIAQLKLSATAPTQEQALFMYEQEKQMFRDGAQSLLPDSGAVVDLAYDDVTDKWIAASAANESSWVGLVRTGVTAVPAGSNIKVQATSGVKLNARSTTSPGVDVTLPAYNLKEEIVKRGEAAAKLSRITSIFDYVGGFTATTVVGNTAITAVLGLVYPSTVNLRGCVVTGTGIPASTTIVDIVGTTIYLSAKATAAGSLVQVSLTDFPLPVGYEAKTVLIGGTGKIEGSTKDYVRLYDGFKETIRFSTAPGYTAYIQLQAIRSAT